MRAITIALASCRAGFDAAPLAGRVTSGSATIEDGATSVMVPLELRGIERAFVSFSYAADDSSPENVHVAGRLESDALTFERDGNYGDVEIRWYVVVLPAGARVQRGRIETGDGNANDSIDAVDVDSSFPIFSDVASGTDLPRTMWCASISAATPSMF